MFALSLRDWQHDTERTSSNTEREKPYIELCLPLSLSVASISSTSAIDADVSANSRTAHV